MATDDALRTRLGALALGASALLLAAFPLLRPFFRLDVFDGDATLRAASPALASWPWVIAHLLAMAAFVLLGCGLLALYAALAGAGGEAPALRALVLCLLGIGLVLPALGVETYVLPLLARAYLEGATGVASLVEPIYRGPMTAIMLVGLALLAAGAIGFARGVWRSGTLPRWAGVALGLGLALWCPIFPRAVRVADGLLIGLGGLWLASRLWYAGGIRASSTTG
jgi:hypothetical protein